jgi:hypothetical protein
MSYYSAGCARGLSSFQTTLSQRLLQRQKLNYVYAFFLNTPDMDKIRTTITKTVPMIMAFPGILIFNNGIWLYFFN